MKIAHESPTSIFSLVQSITDYDYALVHLFEENKTYLDQFKRAVDIGREVILDNSIFELGTAFNGDTYYKWINELRPEWYIIPDVLEDSIATVKNLDNWQRQYKVDVSKSIGVVQGKSIEDIVWCYKEIEPKVDKVAISFDYSFFNDKVDTNKYFSYMYGRIHLMNKMLEMNIINKDKPHHLLGCGLPQEFASYKDPKYSWIDSVDTSNPVVHGLNNIRYKDNGLTDKISTKLIEYISTEVTQEQIDNVIFNIEKFRSFCR